MTDIRIFDLTISPWIYLPLVYFLWVTLFLILKKAFFLYIKVLSRKTKTRLDDLLIRAADFPVTMLIFTSGAVMVEKWMPVSAGQLTTQFLLVFKAATIVAVVLFIDRFISGVIKYYSDHIEILRTSGGVARVLVRVVVISLGFLILLDSFGISITPIIASLGIGSLAVALALQPTLENFFSGIQLVADKSIQVGQFIKLESGEEGYVYRIGWRSTWIRMLPNNMIVIPNKNLVNAKVINYYYPDTETALLLEAGVHYESDLDKVERVTIEVGREVLKEITGGVKSFDPFIRFHTFGDFSINFTIILRVNEFTQGYLVKHEMVKRLKKRYAEEGIVIPYPIQAQNFKQERVFDPEYPEVRKPF